ncbi:bifunctional 3-(3-hydroxy-phenyl)propionate/3-hydroxycinnamic acid hydroxylase [Rhodoferax sp. GW822-FHT02A01]|uniref:bifunctional 3-(3-hydroxy-phenyl)propionate/3-hydroxycinnamic acid hydroxylase n=1 Tax=Rhodoferax sp. GW822-FHT02A01 TaxID=3141537 RepID=UPI00315CADC4
MIDADIIISGLGPTGATLAGLLGQRGIRVVAFDKLPDLFPLPRAAGLDHEVMRILQELQVADRVEPFIAPYRPSEYRGMEGQLIKRLDATPPPFKLGWAPNYVFNQPALERTIRSRLTELPTVRTECSAEVLDVGQESDHVWADVRLASNQQTTRYRARYLIACDGGSSPIRKRLGITLEDLGFDEPWLVVDAIVNDDKLEQLPQTQVQYCEADRPATYIVGVGKHRRWELMLLPGESLSPEFPDGELWPLLERWLLPHEGKIWRAAAYRFHGLVANAWRHGRILLAGDAAHMTPPFMTQGMVQGMRDAQNLAWKLERILRNQSPASLLESYQQERRPHVTTTTQTAMALGRVICERDPEQARARDERLIEEQGGSISTTFRQNLIPGLTCGLIAFDSPGAGSILPQPFVRAHGFEGRLDDLTGPTVRVIAIKPLTDEDRNLMHKSLSPIGGILLELASDTDRASEAGKFFEEQPTLSRWLIELDRTIVIVRPDHYVFATAASPAEAVTLITQLYISITTS